MTLLVDNDRGGGGGGGDVILGLVTEFSTEAIDGFDVEGTREGERSEAGRRAGGGVGVMLEELLDERSRPNSGDNGLASSSSRLGDKRPPDSLRFLLFETSWL